MVQIECRATPVSRSIQDESVAARLAIPCHRLVRWSEAGHALLLSNQSSGMFGAISL